MQVNKPELHPMALGALRELQSSGIDITPEIVIWLQDAATRITKVKHRPVSELVDWPVSCGGVWLYPLSFGAAEWLSSLPESVQYDVRYIAFACAYSRKPEIFEKISGSIVAALAVKKWLLCVKCSLRALSVGVDAVIGLAPSTEIKAIQEPRAKDNTWEWGAMIRALCQKYPGISPDYWMWSVSREKCCSMLQQDNQNDPDFVSGHEIEANIAFRSIVEHLKQEHANGR